MKDKIVYQNKKLNGSVGDYGLGAAIGTDDTDHFNFICSRCLVVMPISLIKYYNASKQLYIHSVCEKCGLAAQRKINIEQTDPIALEAIVNKNVVLLHRGLRKRFKIDPESKEEFEVTT